jgi:hypothetical protein
MKAFAFAALEVGSMPGGHFHVELMHDYTSTNGL